jgi:3-oxoacyl-[acyl-carrier protein] reductase
MMGKLQTKVAIVTGSGRGIGRAIALRLARDGARLVVNDLDEVPAREVVSAIQASGGEAIACVGNVTATDFGDRIVRQALDEFGGLDIIVNNAGYTWDNVIHKMSDEQFQAMLDVHLVAPFRILRAAAEPFRMFAKKDTEAGRRVLRKVVNISSISGTAGNAGQVNYAAAKAGMVGLTKALSKEGGRYNVNVNAVAYGYIETRLTQPLGGEGASIDIEGREVAVGMQPTTIATLKQMIPLGRGGTPDEAAGAVFMLCSDDADYITGQTIICGGGMGSLA